MFREIISACRGLEEAIRVAYLGPEGTFSEQAVRKHFGAAVEAPAAASVDEAFRSCRVRARAQFTVVPVENSTDGVVGRTLDLLLADAAAHLRRDRAAGAAKPACQREEH